MGVVEPRADYDAGRILTLLQVLGDIVHEIGHPVAPEIILEGDEHLVQAFPRGVTREVRDQAVISYPLAIEEHLEKAQAADESLG